MNIGAGSREYDIDPWQLPSSHSSISSCRIRLHFVRVDTRRAFCGDMLCRRLRNWFAAKNAVSEIVVARCRAEAASLHQPGAATVFVCARRWI